MTELGISGASGWRRIRTTDSNHDNPVAENLLQRDFTATAPNQRWVTDITGIEMDEGVLYLSAIEDLFSRKVVGWAMDAHMETSLIVRALDMALGNRQPDTGLNPSQRPWLPIHQRWLPTTPRRPSHDGQHEPARQL